MKKTLFCILTLTLLLTLGLLTCAAEEEKNVTCYVGEITVDGEIDEIIDALATADQAEKLKNAQ